MQLVYLYIDGYSKFQKTEFNFSQDLHIHFDVYKRVLEISYIDSSLPERFWGENIKNFSVIIGNNGAGKTSLIQYLMDIFLESHGGHKADGQGIVIFEEENRLYGYYNQNWEEGSIGMLLKSERIISAQWLELADVESILGRTKMIYLTNALSVRDTRRSLWYNGDRFAPLYDCSMGNLVTSNIERDMNKNLRKSHMGASETEAYFLYEQYKQIKFIFDRRQNQICNELKEEGFPVPVPKVLYVDLLLGNQLNTVLDGVERRLDQMNERIEGRVFQNLYPYVEVEENPYVYLWKQLNRTAIWCAIRSALRCMSEAEKEIFVEYLWGDEQNPKETVNSYRSIFERIWSIIEDTKINRESNEGERDTARNKSWEILRECYGYYIDFLNYIKVEILEKHFRIDKEEWKTLKQHWRHEVITFAVNTDDADWFMEFLKKYRYICNPDYFLDFHWELSSGENSLLSLFASFYYIFDADYTNTKHGDYKIVNNFTKQLLNFKQLEQSEQLRKVQCDSIIVLIDEADLTYHPEWQRVFIALLTAFLPKVYPKRFCKDIQIVLSTHSPILLSDVPQQNVIYLKYNSEKRCTMVDDSVHKGTFGQNVHLLFKDSFFLKNGTIGLFAQRKMSELVHTLKEIEEGIEPKKDKRESDKSKQKDLKQNRQKKNKFERNKEEQISKEYARVSEESFAYRLEHECRPYVKLIEEPIIQRKIIMWIDKLEQKLSKSKQNAQIQNMTDEELDKELGRLRKEMDRRRHDQNFNI